MSNATKARLTSAERKQLKVEQDSRAAAESAELERFASARIAEIAAREITEHEAKQAEIAARAPKLKQKTSSAGRDALDNGGARARAINAVLIERGALGASVKEVQAICDAKYGASVIKAISNHMLHLLKRNLIVRLSTGRYRLTDETIAAIAPSAPVVELVVAESEAPAVESEAPKAKRTRKAK